MSATLTVPERPGVKFNAKLVDTDDAITPSSGTLLVQLAVDNHDGLLIPGEYTEVHFALPTNAHALSIPASSLIFRQNGLQVAVLGKGNRAELKPVSIATDLGTHVEIASGLNATDRVIDNPPDSLASGDEVRLQTGASGTSDTALAGRRTAESTHG
jgi:multidrug efflux pump subunit AcrA (membrane-fusion protein)